MSRAVGIDLGTTNSLVGFVQRGRQVVVTDPVTSREWMPSLVGIDPRDPSQRLVVGSDVEALVKAGHASAIHSVKRLMGRRWEDPHVQRLVREHRLSYEIREHPDHKGEVGVVLGGRVYTPTEISSLILRRLKENAEQQGLDAVSHAVITVPAYFRDPAIHATREAGRLAGLRVKHIMPEPTAAAVAYGADDLDDGTGRYVVVFDFGGGTFDVSVILAAAGTLNVLRVGGDNFLGGDDVDRAVMERFDRQLRDAYGASLVEGTGIHADDLPNLETLRWRLRLAARQAKEGASATGSATVIEPTLLRTADGRLANQTWMLSRADLAELARPFVDRAMQSVSSTLEQASLAAADVDQVIVAGGSSRLPGVVDGLRELFPSSEVLNTINPMTAIAVGAIKTSRVPFPWNCPACGRENDLTSPACVGCQTPAPSELHACASCGALMAVAETTCPNPQCTARVVVHAAPVEVLSHDIKIRVRGTDGDSLWETVIHRDTPIDPNRIAGSEASPWRLFEAQRSAQDHILLPIAQDQDEDDEEPELIAAYRVMDLPADLSEGETIEVRMRLDGDRVATAEVMIRGRIHATERVAASEYEGEVAGEAEGDEVAGPASARSQLTWLRINALANRHIPMRARHPANQALIEESRATASTAMELAQRLDDAMQSGVQREIERVVAESEEALEEALPIAFTVSIADMIVNTTSDPVVRSEVKRALDLFIAALRDGDEQDSIAAWRALQTAVNAAHSAGADDDVPHVDRNLLRTAQLGQRPS